VIRVAADPAIDDDIREQALGALARRKALETNASVRKLLDMNADARVELNNAMSAIQPEEEEDEEEREQRLTAEADAWNDQQVSATSARVAVAPPNPYCLSCSQAGIANEILERVKQLELAQARAQEEMDPVEKSKLLLKCRQEHATLRQMSRNIEDVSKKLDVVIEFMGNLNSTLLVLDEKLDAILDAVGAMREDLRRLTGKPVLEVFAERKADLLERSTKVSGVARPSAP
jgi:hypothetical protein